MSDLLELQRRMARAVMHPLTRNETMRQRQKGTAMDTEAAAFIKPNDRLSSFDRLEIYNRQYWFRLYTAFEEDFPGLQAVVGRKKFEGLMRSYLTDCPSTSFTLRNLGSKLSEWLPAHLEWTEPRTALALDMAHLEWAHIEAFDEAGLPPLVAEDMAQLGPESVLTLQPYIRLLSLQYPVDDLLIAVRSETGSSDASSNNATVARHSRIVRKTADLEKEEIFLALHRRENSVFYKRLHREDYHLLGALAAGKTLGQALEEAFEGSVLPEEDRAAFLQEAFQTWAMLGWFAKERQD